MGQTFSVNDAAVVFVNVAAFASINFAAVTVVNDAAVISDALLQV